MRPALSCRTMKYHPLPGYTLLLDEQPVPDKVRGIFSRTHNRMDYAVVDGGFDGCGVGDIAVLDDPYCGKQIMIDGTVYRLVKNERIVAIVWQD